MAYRPVVPCHLTGLSGQRDLDAAPGQPGQEPAHRTTGA